MSLSAKRTDPGDPQHQSEDRRSPVTTRHPPPLRPPFGRQPHCLGREGAAPDILALKPRPVGGPPPPLCLGPVPVSHPVWFLPASQALARDKRLRKHLGCEGRLGWVEGQKRRLATVISRHS